jgi:hypothetical protein
MINKGKGMTSSNSEKKKIVNIVDKTSITHLNRRKSTMKDVIQRSENINHN